MTKLLSPLARLSRAALAAALAVTAITLTAIPATPAVQLGVQFRIVVHLELPIQLELPLSLQNVPPQLIQSRREIFPLFPQYFQTFTISVDVLG